MKIRYAGYRQIGLCEGEKCIITLHLFKKLWLFAVDSLTNKRGEGHIPDNIIKDIARFLLPNIKAFFDSDEGRAEFEKWKTEQKNAEAALEKKEKSGEKPPL